ncbi:MAG: DNA translocase FtsK 4TM domain-containing protein [Anaerolineaceae bacterium]|nr:DNA translocase FtsK 4TM domain-containing protein [Anaerolineaceae bacterium]
MPTKPTKKTTSRTSTASASKAKSTQSKSTASKKTSSSKAKQIPEPHLREKMSPERKADLIGIILIVISLVSLLLTLTQVGELGKWWTNTMNHVFGWGAYILPIILIALGIWFMLYRNKNLPQVTSQRLIGTVYLFVNLLLWFEVFSPLFPTTAESSAGGLIGSFINGGLVNLFGKAGSMIVLIAWLLLGLVLLFDLSIADVVAWITGKVKQIRAKTIESKRQKSLEKAEEASKATNLSQKLPKRSEPKPVAVKPKETKRKQTPTEIASDEQGEPVWNIPVPTEVLDPVKAAPIDMESDEDRARVIEGTLRAFNAPGKVIEIRRGPTITMFGVEPEFIENRSGKTRVRVNKITGLADDLAMALKASRIRMQAPVPGKGYIGVEVPNRKTAMVSMLDIVESPQFIGHPSPLKFALGKDVTGKPITADLAQMPHLLVAGTTGSGKSVCVNSILTGFLLNLSPDKLRLLLVDPKRVELSIYNGIPHLLTDVIVDVDKVTGALQWMLREMDLRYRMFEADGARNLDEYNYHRTKAAEKQLPFIVVVIDELADLMMLAPTETETSLARLAQLARATGIHLIIATQRPSVDVLTGLIKANFPARIAFAVASNTDSRVILDQPGAERLLSKGDMLFQEPTAPAPIRLQGTYISDQELAAVTDFWRSQNALEGAPERPDKAILSTRSHLPMSNLPEMSQKPLWQEMEKDPNADPIEEEAIKIIRKEGRASVSMLQQKMRIGYTRSSRLIEKLEEDGIIGPPNPQTGTRQVLDWGDYPPLKQD